MDGMIGTEGVAFGVEAIITITVSIRCVNLADSRGPKLTVSPSLWYYWVRYRPMTNMERMRRDSNDERIFVVSTWILSLGEPRLQPLPTVRH